MKRKKYIPILIIVAFGICLIIINQKSQLNNSYEETTIFKSERAFGDDYFDIYKINSNKNQKSNWKSLDDNYFKESKRFKQMIESYKSEINNYDDLKDMIFNLEKDDNTVYIYEENIDKNGHRTLYLYNKDLEIGYIFDFQI